MFLADLPVWLILAFAGVLGLLFGSFLNVVIHRLPRGENLAFPASACPACGTPIAPYDNIPVVSWLWLRGKSRCCKQPISGRYPAVEALGGLMGLAIVYQLILPLPPGTSLGAAVAWFGLYLTLSLSLIAALFIDLEFMILPDELTLGGAALGLFTLPWRPIALQDALLGAAVGYGLVAVVFHHGYRLLRGQPGMGLGDAKLLLLTGVWFGWQGVVFALLAGSVQGTVVALTVFAVKGRIDEPEAVRAERAELQAAIAALPQEEREAIEAELDDDLLASEPGTGLGAARIAFGPFLILGTLEFMLAEPWIYQLFYQWLGLA